MTSIVLSGLLTLYFIGVIVVFTGLMAWHDKDEWGDFDASAATFTGLVWPVAALLIAWELGRSKIRKGP